MHLSHPHPTPAAEADARLRNGEINEAIRAYRRAIKETPDSAWCHHGLGEAAARKGWFLLARSLFRHALEQDPGEVKRWQAANTPDYATGTPVPEPVFVLGCPHSGTTIATRLIAAHPNIMNAEMRESQLFSNDSKAVDAALARWDRACLDAGKTRWVEKSVIHTFMVPKLLAARPRARLVLMVRDGRDVVASMKTRKYAFTGLDDLIASWTLANAVMLEFRDRPGTILVRYEDLVRQPEVTLRRICDTLGEAFAPEMMRPESGWIEWNGFQATDEVGVLGDRSSHGRLRAWQINQPLFDGTGRWRTELDAGEKLRVKELAQSQLVAFGYAENDHW